MPAPDEVTLRPVSRENVRAICELRLGDHQAELVAPAAFTVAEGLYEPGALLRAIYAGDEPAGVLLVEVETGTPYLVRFMVDADHQRRGIGQRAVELLATDLAEGRMGRPGDDVQPRRGRSRGLLATRIRRHGAATRRGARVHPRAVINTPMPQDTVQRSFRLTPRTVELLTERAAQLSEPRNALVERLIGEGLRTERHPLVRFRAGGSGVRRPALAGTRLDLWHVIETVRSESDDVAAASAYLSVPEHLVEAALAYHADFPDEVDAHRDAELGFAVRERATRRARA